MFYAGRVAGRVFLVPVLPTVHACLTQARVSRSVTHRTLSHAGQHETHTTVNFHSLRIGITLHPGTSQREYTILVRMLLG